MTLRPNPTDVVRRVMLAVVKARSIAAENEGLDVAAYISPRLYGTDPLSLLTVCERILDCGRNVAPIDAMNVLTLARREPQMSAMYWLRWNAEMPEPLSMLA